jgi:hypothetical protein
MTKLIKRFHTKFWQASKPLSPLSCSRQCSQTALYPIQSHSLQLLKDASRIVLSRNPLRSLYMLLPIPLDPVLVRAFVRHMHIPSLHSLVLHHVDPCFLYSFGTSMIIASSLSSVHDVENSRLNNGLSSGLKPNALPSFFRHCS